MCQRVYLIYPIQARKILAEALILSKIDYGSIVYQKVPKFLIKRLQKIQTISAGYVLNRYAKECDVIKLVWLSIIERFEFNTTKLAFKALHCPEWPDNDKFISGAKSVFINKALARLSQFCFFLIQIKESSVPLHPYFF